MKSFFVALIVSVTLTGAPSIYDFKVPALDGGTIKFSDYKGKCILIVNTASKCGNTPQYKDLEDLYEKYKDRLVIVGFPANNFGGQEPGTSDEIKEFCKKNYGVTFPMADKVSVKGDDMAPIFKYLVEKSTELGRGISEEDPGKGFYNDPVTWNFTKFLLDKDGKLVAVFHNKKRLVPENAEAYNTIVRYVGD